MLHGIGKCELAVGSVLLLTFACVYAESPQTGVSGTVSVSPARPGPQRAGELGAAPLRGAVVYLRDAEGMVLARTVADAQGHYTLLVPDGDYEVQVGVQGRVFPRCRSVDTSVRAGQLVHVDIVCDSGMR